MLLAFSVLLVAQPSVLALCDRLRRVLVSLARARCRHLVRAWLAELPAWWVAVRSCAPRSRALASELAVGMLLAVVTWLTRWRVLRQCARTCNPRLRGPMAYPLGHGAAPATNPRGLGSEPRNRNTRQSARSNPTGPACGDQMVPGSIPGGRRLRLVGLHIYLLRWNPAAGLVGSGARKVGHRVPHVPLATRNGELGCVAGLRCGFAPPVLLPPAKTNRRHAICNCGDGAVVFCSRRRFTRLANLISANSRLRWRACQAP